MDHIEARNEIWRNVSYVREQLPKLALEPAIASRMERLCDDFGDALRGMAPLPLEALDRLVRDLDADPACTLASILMNESGANILRASAALERLPPPVAERRFDCAACGRAAGVLRIRGDGAMERHSFTSTMSVLSVDAATIRGIIESGDVKALYDHDLELASFYCPKCDACYCRDHWGPRDVFDEDGFHDCIRGTCPAGHERMLED